MNKQRIQPVLILTLSMLAAGTIIFGVACGTQGGVQIKYEDDIAKLMDKKTRLETQLFSATSLTKMTQVAQSEGWIAPNAVAYIQKGETTAAAQ